MPDGQIGRLAVLEAERRQGIGRQLMEAVIEFGERQSVGRFLTLCMLSSMNRWRVMCSSWRMPCDYGSSRHAIEAFLPI